MPRVAHWRFLRTILHCLYWTRKARCSIDLTQFAQPRCVTTLAGYTARSLAVNADGSRLYMPVVFSANNTFGLVEYDAKSLTVTRQLSVAPASTAIQCSLVFSGGSNSIYLAPSEQNTNPMTGSLIRVDLGTFNVAVTQPLSFGPLDPGASSDGKQVVVVGSLKGAHVFNGTTLTPTGTILGGLGQSVILASEQILHPTPGGLGQGSTVLRPIPLLIITLLQTSAR